MKNTRALSMWGVTLGTATAVLLSLPGVAQAQWKWRDANGVMQYTDRPPPAGTPDSQILTRPAAARAPKLVSNTPPASTPEVKANAPTATPKSDPELEAKRKKAEEQKAAERKVEEERQAKVRGENCERARGYERSLQSGQRIVRTNEKGEREVLDDTGRADEMQRTREAIDSNCR
jgi:hypothetical protein